MCFLQDTIEYMTVGVCVHFMKKSFSQTVSEPEFLLSTYNISTDQSKDDYHLVTAGDYVLNTLLVVSLVCLSFCLFVCLFVCLSVCPPVFSETARYTLMKLCNQVTYVERQKPIDFGVN